MRIALRNASTLYPLAGAAGVSERTHSSAADLQIQPSIIVQADARLRAAAMLHRDRLNLATTIGFSTTRVFASVREAEVWARRYDGDFPRTGTLVCDSIDALSALTYRDEYADAVVEPPSRSLMGATVMLRYLVRCGAITEVGQVETIPDSVDVSGSTNPGAGAINGTYAESGTFNSRPYFEDGTYEIAWTGTRWEVRLILGGNLYYYSTENVPSPHLCTTWTNNAAEGATGTLSVVETP